MEFYLLSISQLGRCINLLLFGHGRHFHLLFPFFFIRFCFPLANKRRDTHRVLREGESKSRCLGVVCYEPAWRQATPPLHRSILDYELHKLWSKFEASPWVLKKKKKWQENGESLRGGGNASAAKENWKDFSCCYSVRESHTQHN